MKNTSQKLLKTLLLLGLLFLGLLFLVVGSSFDARAGVFSTSLEERLAMLGPIERPLVQCVERYGLEHVGTQAWPCLRNVIPKSQPGLRRCVMDALTQAKGAPLKLSVLRACMTNNESSPESCFALEGFGKFETLHDEEEQMETAEHPAWIADRELLELCVKRHIKAMKIDDCLGVAATMRGLADCASRPMNPRKEDWFTARCIRAKKDVLKSDVCLRASARLWDDWTRKSFDNFCIGVGIRELERDTKQFDGKISALKAEIEVVSAGVKYVEGAKELAELYRAIYGGSGVSTSVSGR